MYSPTRAASLPGSETHSASAEVSIPAHFAKIFGVRTVTGMSSGVMSSTA